MSETKKVARTVTEYKTLNSTYQVDEEAKQWRRVTGVNRALESQGTDGEWQPYDAKLFTGHVLYVYHPNGQFRTSLVQSSETVALTE